jgi:hypothetical protein
MFWRQERQERQKRQEGQESRDNLSVRTQVVHFRGRAASRWVPQRALVRGLISWDAGPRVQTTARQGTQRLAA